MVSRVSSFFFKLFLFCLICNVFVICLYPGLINSFCEPFIKGSAVPINTELDKKYEELRRQYRTLVINDPEVRDASLWDSLATDFEIFLSDPSLRADSKYKPKVIYLLGRLFEQRESVRASSIRQSVKENRRSEILFKKLVQEFPDDELSDDALLALSRIYHQSGRYFDERQVLIRIIGEYPSGNTLYQAKRSLDDLYDSGKIKPEQGGPRQLIIERDRTLPIDRVFKERSTPPAPALVIGSLENKYPVVMIDPGHGGDEDGALGPGGIREKDIVLSISRMLKKRLQTETKVRVLLTRSGDETLTLQERTSKANQANAELFVSIHANASEYKTGKGVETYYLDNTNDKSSLRLAERENFVEGAPRTDLSFIVSDFIQGIKMDDSISAAHLINASLVKNLSRSFDSVKNLGVKKAPFYVLVGAHMPCVLVEVSFIDHPVEGRRLATTRYQQVAADGIFEGIMGYLRKKGRI
ncbi:MAG TPA: N-acetylmuramoyl-L-alanine amidase [Oligoflexia bacterium]|nr:N-acetylmuramoyl-L-alanine amidase [Oligoflexia bacterium]HMP47155.1 N-acetylmuramoyl-L-alanine amidase [Oligoflexia bacterium]